jgi:ribosomal protein S18 acetylase RimI-like enzyme
MVASIESVRVGTLARMDADDLLVERVSESTDELVEAMARLVPQLSSTAPAPDRATLAQIVSSPGCSLLVARLASRGGEIVGSLTLVSFRIPTGLHAMIEDVVVDDSARGHGIGAALVAEAVWLARERGARHVSLTSRPSREAANRLYARAGFVKRATNVYRLDLN